MLPTFRLPTLLACAFALVLAACDTPASTTGEDLANVPSTLDCDPQAHGLTLPDGFCAVVVADSVGRARHLAVRDNGDVYVALRQAENGGGTVALRDTDGDGRADETAYFGTVAGTGMEVHGGYLYASSDTAVGRYPLADGQLVPTGDWELIAGGFPDQGSHASKTFAFDAAGNMYVNIGAPSNACMEEQRTMGSPGQDPCPQLERQAGIWRFAADQPGQTQQGEASHFTTGIRHAVALAWDDASNSLYVVQHGRDQLAQLFPDLYTNEESAQLPSEELLSVQEGDDFGWPYCYNDHLQGQKVLAPEYGGDGQEVGRCADKEAPIAAFPGHYAPNDLVFYSGNQFPARYRNGAFIAFHGSWNRAPLEQEGYNVVFVPFEAGSPSGDYEVFANGFAGVDYIERPNDAAHRPTGLAIGPDGSLYVADSVRGKIYRIMYTG